MSLSSSSAEVIAVQAVAWLAGHDELLQVFMGATGAGEDTFRQSVEDVDFQASVLDFILMDDDWVRQFCDATRIPYEMLFKVRQVLSGGADVHWT